jgi:hypothetical protein
MMGRHETGQRQLFYAFDLDVVVPADHLIRKMDAVRAFDWVRRELAGYDSHTGRPSTNPELIMRMLIVGYLFSIRSERHLRLFRSAPGRGCTPAENGQHPVDGLAERGPVIVGPPTGSRCLVY